jgi:hypothetical protein
MDRGIPRDEDGLAPDRRVTTAVAASGTVAPGEPLTERILDWIGGPRWLWVVLWASIALVRPLVLLVSLTASGQTLDASEWTDVLDAQVILGYVTLVSLFGTWRLFRGARALAPDLAKLAHLDNGKSFFPAMASVAGPVALLAIVSVVSFATGVRNWGPVSGIADLPLLIANTLPIMTFVWTYLALLAGINALGRFQLSLDVFPQDRTLGLGPVGSLALTGFWLVLIAAVPLIVVTADNLATVGMSLAVIGVSTALFFLSMSRLHRQLAAAKAGYVGVARSLYAEAYKPVRAKPSLKALEAQAATLQVTQALVDRAERVQEWPIDERATAWVVVVVTGVVTSLLVRLVLAATGA